MCATTSALASAEARRLPQGAPVLAPKPTRYLSRAEDSAAQHRPHQAAADRQGVVRHRRHAADERARVVRHAKLAHDRADVEIDTLADQAVLLEEEEGG